MVLVGVGYTVSTVVAKTPDAKSDVTISNVAGNTLKTNSIDSLQVSGNVFSSFEQAIANKATSLRNEFVTTEQNDTSTPLVETETSDTFVAPASSQTAQISLATQLPLPEVYDDIGNSSFQYEILNLYSNKLVSWVKHFYPNNAVRVSDFIRVVMDAYHLQQWFDLHILEWWSKNQYIIDSSFPTEVLLRVNSAYEAWFLQKLALYDAKNQLRLNAFISPSEAMEILRLMALKSPNLVKISEDTSFQSSQTLRKDEMAKLVVESFNLQFNQRSLPGFSDIYWSKYQDAIQALANLWVVGWVGGKFYPDASLENKDFVIMLARILLIQHGLTQASIDNFYYLTNLKNASTTASYSPYLEYCLEYEMCTTLLSQTPSGVTFQANKQLYFSDLVPLLSSLTSTSIILPSHWDWELITRWEAAYLLSQVIAKQDSATTSEKESTDEKTETPSLTSSLRTKFQELMKVS